MFYHTFHTLYIHRYFIRQHLWLFVSLRVIWVLRGFLFAPVLSRSRECEHTLSSVIRCVQIGRPHRPSESLSREIYDAHVHESYHPRGGMVLDRVLYSSPYMVSFFLLYQWYLSSLIFWRTSSDSSWYEISAEEPSHTALHLRRTDHNTLPHLWSLFESSQVLV